MKKAFIYLLSLIIVTASAACGGLPQPDTDQEPQMTETPAASSYLGPDILEESKEILDPSEYQFAVIYGGVHPFFDPWKPGAKAAAQDLGIPEPYVVSPQAWDQP